MKTVLAVLVSVVGIGLIACNQSEAESDVESAQGAQSTCSQAAVGSLQAAVDGMSGSSLKLTTAPRDPSSIPVGARSPKYITSLDLKKTGKFSAKLNNGTKMAGTYAISKPSRAKKYVILTLDPAGEEAEGFTFKVFHDGGSDFDLPAGAFGFIGEGFTPFNMKTQGVTEERVDEAQSCNCDELPRPRCMGTYVCESGECVWRSPVGSRCGGPI